MPTKMTPEGPRLEIDPARNILRGFRMIAKYMHIRTPKMLNRLVHLYGFPAMKMPDNTWISSMTAIDQWIFMASYAESTTRPVGYTGHTRTETSLAQLLNAIRQGEPGPKAQFKAKNHWKNRLAQVQAEQALTIHKATDV